MSGFLTSLSRDDWSITMDVCPPAPNNVNKGRLFLLIFFFSEESSISAVNVSSVVIDCNTFVWFFSPKIECSLFLEKLFHEECLQKVSEGLSRDFETCESWFYSEKARRDLESSSKLSLKKRRGTFFPASSLLFLFWSQIFAPISRAQTP